MAEVEKALRLTALCVLLVLAGPLNARAQNQQESEVERLARLGRRGAGLRVGFWNADVASTGDVSRSPHVEIYFQRGLDKHLALENSAAVWRVNTPTSKSYIVPLLTSLKFYPVSEPGSIIEPIVLGGVGFGLAIEDFPENAIGSSRTTVVTGFAFRAGLGLELAMTSGFGLSAVGKYQWIRLGEDVGGSQTYSGLGLEGGITYRFQF